MKKKGLIISTIVMVVVLIASLTTATYAWFSTSAVTSLGSFDVSVQTSNLFKIGLSKTGTYNATVAESQFVTGAQVSTKAGTPGQLVCGGWENGNNGLSSTLETDVHWGPQSKAVGFAASALTQSQMQNGGVVGTGEGQLNIAELDVDAAGTQYVYAANGSTVNEVTTLEGGITNAYANEGSASNSNADYVYLFLGVAPNTALAANTAEIIIMVDGTTNTDSQLLGILAAIHVAWRLNAETDWTDVDVFGNSHWDSYKSGESAIQTKGTPRSSATGERTVLTTGDNGEAATFNATYTSSAPATGAAFVRIPLTQTEVGGSNIDQVQILIYIDGTDSDCIREATNSAGGTVRIFFHGEKAAAQG